MSRLGFFGIVMTLLFLLPTGCGSQNKIVPVSGVVLIDGVPLKHGTIQVAPDGFRAASGDLDANGRFTLTTEVPNDGCVVGTHSVAVVATETLGPGSQRWHAPKKYAALETSGLKVTINGATNDLKIELTWEGGKPFVEQFSKE